MTEERSQDSPGLEGGGTTRGLRHLGGLERGLVEALSRYYEYYDPIHTLPEAGRAWWAQHADLDASDLRAAEVAEASRRTAALQAW